MASTFSLVFTAADGETPVTSTKRSTALNLRNWFHKRAGGHSRAADTVACKTGQVYATGSVTCAAVAGADTVTLNGTALTATQHNSAGTVTAASVSVADTVTVNGTVYTAAAAENTVTRAFDQSGSDTACAASLVACINANETLVTATNAAAVVTIRALTAGTGGDAITLATSNNTRLAKSGTTLAGGATVANNQFDYKGSNTQTAAALAAAINASTTALISKHVTATSALGVVTLTAVIPGHAGNAVTTASSNGTRLAVTGSAARLTGGTETLTTHTY